MKNRHFILLIPLAMFMTVIIVTNAFAGHWTTPISGTTFMHIAGKLTIGGASPQVNDEVGVFDSNGKLIGLHVLTADEINGSFYPDVAINADNPTSTTVDEGATAGESLSIKVWSNGGSREFSGSEISLAPGTDLIAFGYQAPASSALTSSALTFAAGNFYDVNITVNTNYVIPNKTVSLADALRALRISMGIETYNLAIGDDKLDVGPMVDGKPHSDGKVDISDAVVLLSKVVGLVNW